LWEGFGHVELRRDAEIAIGRRKRRLMNPRPKYVG